MSWLMISVKLELSFRFLRSNDPTVGYIHIIFMGKA